MMGAFAALASGCAEVIVSDVAKAKLDIIAKVPGVVAVDLTKQKLADVVAARTAGKGCRPVLRGERQPEGVSTTCWMSSPRVAGWVLVGMPQDRVPLDGGGAGGSRRSVSPASSATLTSGIARWALLGSGKIDLKPLISASYPFDKSVEAFERAAQQNPSDVKVQITF